MGRHPDDPLAYYDFRDNMAADILLNRVRARAEDMARHAVKAGAVHPSVAPDWVARFFDEVSRRLAWRRAHGRR